MANGHEVREKVREGYAKIAESGVFLAGGQEKQPSGGGCCGGGSCCGPVALSSDQLAAQIGYSAEEIESLPEGANMGLSCGNPAAIAALRTGEVVLDLGSGGGFDAFLCGPKVGPSGRVIGVDMTPEMLAKARRNITAYRERTGLDNVEFRLGEIEHLPLPDASVDVVISNCVLNLSPEKRQVWQEIARVLKPGGRVAVSDLALLRPLPEAVLSRIDALVGCVAGAELIADTERWAMEAGLVDVVIKPKPEYVAALTQFDDPLYREIASLLPDGTITDYLTSADISARKR